MKDILHEASTALLAFAIGLVPAALGAAVSLAYEAGLTWAMRFTQFAVGVTVSYFATNVTVSIWARWAGSPPDPYIQQAVGFVVGMIAFKAVPRFRDSAVEAVASLPSTLRDMIPFRRKGGDGDAA
jgi:hypothetical protein